MKPLADLAHSRGAWLYADAVQAVGMFPIDVKASGVDAMTTGTYKWLLGSFGVAPFYVRREILDRVPPDRMGELHVERELPDHRYEIYKTARKFDYATLAFGPVYQLGAALDYLERVGVARIEAHTVGLASELATGLRSIGIEVLTPPGNRSSIVSFRNPAEAGATRAALDAARTQVSLRQAGAEIRVARALQHVRRHQALRDLAPHSSARRAAVVHTRHASSSSIATPSSPAGTPRARVLRYLVEASSSLI
jgi:selenocysteine lyase/cysteine desulfurase